jgi:hypothetical protein
VFDFSDGFTIQSKSDLSLYMILDQISLCDGMAAMLMVFSR